MGALCQQCIDVMDIVMLCRLKGESLQTPSPAITVCNPLHSWKPTPTTTTGMLRCSHFQMLMIPKCITTPYIPHLRLFSTCILPHEWNLRYKNLPDANFEPVIGNYVAMELVLSSYPADDAYSDFLPGRARVHEPDMLAHIELRCKN
jgi:hypothetical protein